MIVPCHFAGFTCPVVLVMLHYAKAVDPNVLISQASCECYCLLEVVEQLRETDTYRGTLGDVVSGG